MSDSAAPNLEATPEPSGAPLQPAPDARAPKPAADPARLRRRILFGLVGVLYLFAFPYHPALRSPNELCRLHQTRALVEYGTIEINRAIQDYGYVGDLSRKDGKYYPSKAPLLSFAAVPLYKVLKDFGGGGRHAVPEIPLIFWSRLLLTVLPTLLMLVLVHRFLRTYVSDLVADGVTATYALGTLAFSYSLLFMSHQTTAVLVFAAFYVLWRALRGDWEGKAKTAAGFVLAGALSGAAVAAEYTGALPLLAVVLFGAIAVLSDASRELKARLLRLGYAAGLATLGALPLVGLLMWYHTAAFGGPFESGYKHLNDAAYQPWHLGGFLGIRYPDPRAFALSFFSPLRGFFALSPFLLLALPGFVLLWRQRSLRAVFWLSALVFAGYTYFTSSFSYDSWGWTTGPRHLTPMVPFLLLPVALVIDGLWKSGRRMLAGAAAGLCAGSVLVTGTSTLINYIPDSASNPLFGLALPLFTHGYLPPTILTPIIANPYSGAALLAVLVLAAIAVFVVLTPPASGDAQATRSLHVPAVAASVLGAVTCAAYLFVLGAATRHDRGDQVALDLLQKTWVVRPGGTFEFWPDAPK